jgi:hypothetical protein
VKGWNSKYLDQISPHSEFHYTWIRFIPNRDSPKGHRLVWLELFLSVIVDGNCGENRSGPLSLADPLAGSAAFSRGYPRRESSDLETQPTTPGRSTSRKMVS